MAHTNVAYRIPLNNFVVSSWCNNVSLLRDTIVPQGRNEALEKYAQDLYKILTKKLSEIDRGCSQASGQTQRLQYLLDELLRVTHELSSNN